MIEVSYRTIGSTIKQRTEKELPGDHKGTPFIGLDDVEPHSTKLLSFKDSSTMKSSAKVFKKGDVLYSRLRPYLNKVWLADRDGLCSAEFIVLPSNDTIDGEFLKYRISAKDFVSFANSLNAGDRPRVDFSGISSFKVPNFSINEQKRIVAKIEELFSELDAGEQSLRDARNRLTLYRQSLLKQAFEGKLTATWRANNPDKLEDPETLLARIQQEREDRYQQQLNDWQEAVSEWEANDKEGKKPSKPRPHKLPAPIANEIIEVLPSLPQSWQWIAVKGANIEISDGPFGSNLKTSDYVASGIQVIRLENIGNGNFISEKQSFISEEKYQLLKKHTVYPGNIIFASFVTENIRSTIVPNNVELSVNKADCFKVVEYGKTFNTAFLNHCFAARYFYKHLESLIHGVGRPRINTTQLGEAPIPLCPPPEQTEIVRILEEQFTTIEQNEKEIDRALSQSQALRQSILKKAFSGQLV